jgi:ABC-type multidrug transport system ATPase subunit
MKDGGARVRLEGISKRFGATLPVDPVSVTVEPGEFLTLLGPSACGKTAAAAPAGALAGRVREASYLSAAAEYAVDTEVGVVVVTDALMPDELLPAGARVWLAFSTDGLAVLPSEIANEAP